MKTGILLIQLGSPRSATLSDVQDYLNEFLGDPLVIKPRPPLWNLLLRFIIAPRRAPRSAKLYQRMLDASPTGEMPLVTHTRNFAQGLSQVLGSAYKVAYCFQYGSSPSPIEALQELAQSGVQHVHAIPMYPQRAEATVEAALRLITLAHQNWNFPLPCPQIIEHREGFCSLANWLEPLAQSIRESIAAQALPPTDIVISMHGYPEARILAGDPYRSECENTAASLQNRLLKEKNWPRDIRFHLCYQSRFGRQRWLDPSSVNTLTTLGKEGASVLVVCPAFTVENLETLSEVDEELRNHFFTAGGRAWQRVECLNARPDWIEGFAEWIQNLGAPA